MPARWIGALAGLAPALAIGLLFAISGSLTPAADVAGPLAAMLTVSVAAGWLGGAFAARRRWFAGTLAYAIAWMAVLTVLAVAQAGFAAWFAAGADAGAVVGAVLGRIAYAPIWAVYFFVPAIVLGSIWVVALRGLTRLRLGGAGGARDAPDSADSLAPPSRRDPFRLGIGAAAIIAGYALVVAAISAGAREAGEFAPPEAVPRALLLAVLFMLPAGVAVVGAVRRSGPILIASGVVCLLQSFVAFSGVTIPFVVPALLLIALGAAQRDRVPTRTAIGAVLVVLLALGAWVAALGMTETSCWVARTNADGTLVYAPIPVPAGVTSDGSAGSTELSLDPGDTASGCGTEPSVRGAAVAALLVFGALAVALAASIAPSTPPMKLAGSA